MQWPYPVRFIGQKREARSRAGYRVVTITKGEEVTVRTFSPEGRLITRIKFNRKEWKKITP